MAATVPNSANQLAEPILRISGDFVFPRGVVPGFLVQDLTGSLYEKVHILLGKTSESCYYQGVEYAPFLLWV